MNTFLSGPMRKIANMGRMGDTELAHVTPEEKKLLKAMGGSGTMNPRTGMPEYFLNELASGIRRAFGQPDPEEEIQSGMDNACIKCCGYCHRSRTSGSIRHI